MAYETVSDVRGQSHESDSTPSPSLHLAPARQDDRTHDTRVLMIPRSCGDVAEAEEAVGEARVVVGSSGASRSGGGRTVGEEEGEPGSRADEEAVQPNRRTKEEEDGEEEGRACSTT